MAVPTPMAMYGSIRAAFWSMAAFEFWVMYERILTRQAMQVQRPMSAMMRVAVAEAISSSRVAYLSQNIGVM